MPAWVYLPGWLYAGDSDHNPGSDNVYDTGNHIHYSGSDDIYNS